ncbi:MAG: hypothetical protein ACPLTR_07330 [Thermacetogeniaceae bacterium]
MEARSTLGDLKIAKINEAEEKQIRDLEQKLGDKYYLIAFDKTDNKRS